MILHWHGTAALTLMSGGVTLAVDPFIGMPLGVSDEQRRSGERAALFRAADAVLVTHGHFDHIYDVAALYRGTDIPVYATQTPCSTLLAQGMEARRLHRLTPPQTVTIGGFCITAYPSRHCVFDLGVVLKTIFRRKTLCHPKRLIDLLRLNRAYPENGETVLYEIAADGKRLQLMGSMGLREDADYPVGADLLILPFQGTGNPAATVQPIIERLQPKAILLDHYDDAFPPLSALIQTDAFIQKTTASGIPAAAMELGKTYQIS